MGAVGARLKMFPTEQDREMAISTRNWTTSTFEVASIFQMPRSGVELTAFRIVISAQSGSPPPNYELSLQGVNASGEPDGTDLGTTTATFTPSGSPTYTVDVEFGDTLGSGGVNGDHYTPSRGDLLAIVIKYVAGGTVIDGSNHITINYRLNISDHYRPQIPYNCEGSSGSWSKLGGIPMMAVKGDDGRYYGGYLGQSITNRSMNSSNLRWANHFKLPTGSFNDIEVIGMTMYGHTNSATAVVKYGIWDSAGTEIAVSTGITGAEYKQGDGVATRLFDSSGTLSAGTDYYIGVEWVSGASGTMSGAVVVVDAQDDFKSWPGGNDIYLCKWTGSAWDTTTYTDNRIISMSLILGSATAPAGGTLRSLALLGVGS
jgi:hypothetical protein